MKLDQDGPAFVVPKIPGMAVIGGIGALLVLLAGGAAALRWARGEALFPADTDTDLTESDTQP